MIETARYGQPACDCGHPWGIHDVYEYTEDGTETCCVEGCTQQGCPGRGGSNKTTVHFLQAQGYFDGRMVPNAEDA